MNIDGIKRYKNKTKHSRNGTAKTEIYAYGIHALCSRHQEIRKLKRVHKPAIHGFRVWPSSWLLMDFLNRRGLNEGSQVLDVGCGWGLAGIYCAKNHDAIVTGIDADSEVFPYLSLHARINKVKIGTLEGNLDDMRSRQLEDYNVIIGADICFWDSMVDSLKLLIDRALATGTQHVIISDPGRIPFEALGRHYMDNHQGEVKDWLVNYPHEFQGRILKIGT